MEYHHYDQNGKHIGSSDDGQGIDPNILGSLFTLGFLAAGLFWLWELVAGWKNYPVPINYFAGYYYYILLVPLKFVGDIWSWNVENPITDYNNLNLIIGVALEALYAFMVLYFLGRLFQRRAGSIFCHVLFC